MPFKELLTHLICLGDEEPQVTAYGPKKRLIIMLQRSALKTKMIIRGSLYRQMSETPLPENHLLDARLRKEKEDAINQINHVRNVLQQIKQEANHLLNH